ncbi:MAG: hypothetical protein K2K02_04690 [Ruminococcus sp.]|nr:hypothetical protein [Ruminococcus sp.]
MDYNNFLSDLFALSAKTFIEKEKSEELKTEKDTSKKTCKCKKYEDFHKELLEKVQEAKKIFFHANATTDFADFVFYLVTIEKMLIDEISK